MRQNSDIDGEALIRSIEEKTRQLANDYSIEERNYGIRDFVKDVFDRGPIYAIKRGFFEIDNIERNFERLTFGLEPLTYDSTQTQE